MGKGGVRINKKRLTIIFLAVVLVGCGFFIAEDLKKYYIRSKLDPQLEMQVAVNTMMEANSYNYSLESILLVDGRQEVISRVEGKKSGGNTHIKGEMVNTPVNIYYIDQTIYNYDSFSEKWLVIESGKTNSEELLISELNPLSNFRFKQIEKVEKVGFEEIEGTDYLVVSSKPAVESQLLETLWKDFEYQFWIDYENKVFTKAVLNATNKKKENTKLFIEVKLDNINHNIVIEAPDTSKKSD